MNLSSEGSPGHRWRVCSEGLIFHTCFLSFWSPCQEAELGLYPMAWSFSSCNDNIVYLLFKVIEKQHHTQKN